MKKEAGKRIINLWCLFSPSPLAAPSIHHTSCVYPRAVPASVSLSPLRTSRGSQRKDCLASKGCSTLSALVDLRSAHSLPETRRGKKNRDSEAGQSQSEVWSGPSGRLCTPPGHRRQSSPFSVCVAAPLDADARRFFSPFLLPLSPIPSFFCLLYSSAAPTTHRAGAPFCCLPDFWSGSSLPTAVPRNIPAPVSGCTLTCRTGSGPCPWTSEEALASLLLRVQVISPLTFVDRPGCVAQGVYFLQPLPRVRHSAGARLAQSGPGSRPFNFCRLVSTTPL